jgi:hypothetical protein
VITGSAIAAVGAVYFAGLIVGSVGFSVANLLTQGGDYARAQFVARRVVAVMDPDNAARGEVMRWGRLRTARVEQAPDGEGLLLRIPPPRARRLGKDIGPGTGPGLVLAGAPALRLIHRAMPLVNASGARRPVLNHAVQLLEATAPHAYLRAAARAGFPLAAARRAPVERLAFEMALYEESERRAMEGELAALEAMWREAEAIAAIADRLPGAPTERT